MTSAAKVMTAALLLAVALSSCAGVLRGPGSFDKCVFVTSDDDHFHYLCRIKRRV